MLHYVSPNREPPLCALESGNLHPCADAGPISHHERDSPARPRTIFAHCHPQRALPPAAHTGAGGAGEAQPSRGTAILEK
jgi:hypothetical protein